MGTRTGALGVLAVLAVSPVSGQPFRLGMLLSTEFLNGLVSQHLTRSEVAIINANVGSATIFDRNAPGGPVTFIEGSSNFLWAQIAEQIAESTATGEPMHLTIKRWSLSGASCASVTTDINDFLARLDDVTAGSGGGSVTSTDEIVVDATAFQIITLAKDAWVTVVPDGSLDTQLQQAAGKLHSAVSRCAVSSAPSVEQHDF
jgi:hypothetical protein